MRIVAAMSGGVDSSVAAYELQQAGHEVIGATIKTWPKEDCGQVGDKLCCSLDAVQMARSVAEDMGIPYYVIDLSEEFAREVKDYFMNEYARGRTPNPCVYCNSKIKFGYLIKKARELGAEKIATGHYARIIEKDGKHYLAEAENKTRDQSYFLYDIPKEELSFIEFPLGEYGKEEVRKIAMEQGFMSATRPASQDICFADSDGDYRKYIEKSNANAFSEGDILDVEGNVIGRHKGIAAYTIGQRHGIGVTLPGGPSYVLKIDPDNNSIVVGKREHAMNHKIRVAGFNWLSIEKLDKPMEFETRLRYNGKRSPAVVTPTGDDEAIVELKEMQFAATPGQAAVFYDGDIVVGGGWIEEVIE